MRGSLETVGLAALLPFLSSVGRTGCVVASGQRSKLEVWLQRGRVVAASFGMHRGLAALDAAMLLVDEGQFVLTDKPAPADRDLDMNAEDLAGHFEELAGQLNWLRRTLPSLTAVPTVTDISGADGEAITLSLGAIGLLRDIDGRRTVADLIEARTPLPAARTLAALADRGIIHFSSPALELPPRPSVAPQACQKLGFADDRANHFPRPTQLHRCFAAETAAQLPVEQQRTLCLTSGFGICPRLNGDPNRTFVRVVEPTSAQVAVAAAPVRSARLSMLAGRVGTAVGALLLIGALVFVMQLYMPSDTTDVQGLAAGTSSSSDQPRTLAPRATPLGRATPLPTVRASVPTPVPAPSSGVLIDESFVDNARGWRSDSQSTAWVDGGYRLTAREAAHFVAVGAPLAHVEPNVVAVAAFRKVGGPEGGGYGLILRDQGGPRDGLNQAGSYYVFEVSDTGDFGVWRRNDRTWIDLAPWTRSSAVHPGQAENSVEVEAMGSQFTVIVNGVQVARLSDAVLAGGGVGLFAGGDGNQVLVTHFAVTQAN